MLDWKTLCKRLLYPSGWLIIVLSLLSVAGLAVVFIMGWSETPFAYAVYPLSAYSLTVVCAFFAKRLSGYSRGIRQKVSNHPLGNRYMTDAAFRVRISLYVSLAINLAYAVFNLTAGVIYSSFWLIAVAVYFILLSLLRFMLLRYMHAGEEKQGLLHEYRRYRLCGLLMLILNISLSGIVYQMVRLNQGYQYPGILIFAVAVYTFYSVVISIVDMVKYRKYSSPVLSASKAIRFVAALVSLLSLETAMLAQFGDDEAFRRIMTACTGAAVCAVVLAVSVYMVVRSSVEINKMRINDSET